MRFDTMRSLLENRNFDGGFRIGAVKGADGQPLKTTINKTMMRIDLAEPLKSGQRFVFSLDFSYLVSEAKIQDGRTGFERFDGDQNDLFEIAHWYPRMAAYYDVYGWQHKQFLGDGEFALEFVNFDVQITVPADHVVASTGELQNPDAVLSATQRSRLQRARLRLRVQPQVHLGCPGL